MTTHIQRNDILKDFLSRHYAEVKHVILEEFDMEKYLKLEKKESYEEGLAVGHSEGRSEAQINFIKLTQHLLNDSRFDDLKRVTEDPKYLELLLQEYKLD